MKKLTAIFVIAALLLNAMTPTLAHAATYLQGTEEKKKTRAVEQASQKPQGKTVMVMSGGKIDSAKVRKGWYAYVVYTSEEGTKRTATGQIMEKGTDHILIRVEDEALKSWKTIAYTDIDTLVIAQHTRDIEEWRNVRPPQRHGEQSTPQLHEGDSRVRVYAPAIRKGRMIGKLVKMTQDTLVIRGELTLYGRRFYQVPLSSISNLEVSIGYHRNTFKGMLFGFAIGTAIFAAITIPAEETPEGSFVDTQGLAELIGAIGGVSIFLFSTLLGAASKSDKWLAVSPQSLNLSFAPTSTKRLRATLTFNF